VFLAWLLIQPLIDDRDAARIERTRAISQALSLVPLADRFLRSIWWWRRALALRALGLTQVRDRTPAIVAALDDEHPDVRAAALDALTDLQDPASLQAIVVRLHDASLHRGRRAAALEAFGRQCEPFLLDLASVDATHRVNYARALALCGSEQSRPTLCAWAADADAHVRAAAFEGLAHVGLDDGAARFALAALEDHDPSVRAMAAHALRGWTGAGDAVSGLVRRLDDPWVVAVQAAESLRSIRPAGLAALTRCAERGDLAGVLARQMLWEEQRQW
jgi:HEAT repeat protein